MPNLQIQQVLVSLLEPIGQVLSQLIHGRHMVQLKLCETEE